MDRQFKGVWVPKEIWLNKDLTPLEKTFLVEIDSLEDDEKGCFASNKHFEEFFGTTSGNTSRTIKSLKDKGYINIEYDRNGKEITCRHIFLNRPPYPEKYGAINLIEGTIKNDIGYYQNDKGGTIKTSKDSNTYISNTNSNKKEYKEKSIFKKPTIEEIETYCKERSNGVDANRFYYFYESKNWMIGKNKMKDWKAAVITWERNKKSNPKWMNEEHTKETISEAEESLLNDLLKDFK